MGAMYDRIITFKGYVQIHAPNESVSFKGTVHTDADSGELYLAVDVFFWPVRFVINPDLVRRYVTTPGTGGITTLHLFF